MEDTLRLIAGSLQQFGTLATQQQQLLAQIAVTNAATAQGGSPALKNLKPPVYYGDKDAEELDLRIWNGRVFCSNGCG